MIILLPLLVGGHFGQQQADATSPESAKGPACYRRAGFLVIATES